jgi:hypothetical protein
MYNEGTMNTTIAGTTKPGPLPRAEKPSVPQKPTPDPFATKENGPPFPTAQPQK